MRGAYLGMLVGYFAFLLALFLPWATFPASDWDTAKEATGWYQYSYSSLIPLALVTIPAIVAKKHIRVLLALSGIVLSFSLFVYSDIINRVRWHYAGSSADSTLGTGFWLGAIAIVTISICSISWSLHTRYLGKVIDRENLREPL